MEKWEPKSQLRCLKCKDVVHSSTEGECKWCSCGSVSIDETRHYTRVNGYPHSFKLEEYGTGQERTGSD